MNGGGKEDQVGGGVVDGGGQVLNLRLAIAHGRQDRADVGEVRKNRR